MERSRGGSEHAGIERQLQQKTLRSAENLSQKVHGAQLPNRREN